MLLKLRSKPGEHTTHIEELPYQKLAQRLPDGLPPNFRLVYGHMGEVLDRTDLLVTVSSTAALESLHRRIPTVVLTDLGVREALGNHHFVGSGCLASWDQLDAGHRPRARRGVAGPAGRRRRRRRTRRPSTRPANGSPSCWPPAELPPLAPVLHTRHRARLPARHPRPPPPRPGRQPAARRARRRQGARPGAADRCAGRRAAPTGTACSASPPSSAGWGSCEHT